MWSAGEGGNSARSAARRPRLAPALARVRADISFAFIDAMLIVMAYTTAMFFRFMEEGVVPSNWFGGYFSVLPVIVIVHLLSNVAFGTYGHMWEYASVGEALRIIGASITAVTTLLVGLFALRSTGAGDLVPGSVLLIGATISLGGMGAMRFRSRMFSFRRMSRSADGPMRTLVVGVGRSAADLARYLGPTGSNTKIVGFVDPTNTHRRTVRRLAGLPVLGFVGEIASLVEANAINQVVIASPGADELSREVVDLCMNVDVRFRIVHELDSVLSEQSGFRDPRDLRLEDLLPRSVVSTDLANVARMLDGKRVLVTGAGGSIGSEIVRQVLDLRPAMVLALDNDETHLHVANLTWTGGGRSPCLVLADIRDAATVSRLFEQYQPEVVFHAAAHKHVPILESFPQEAVKTNVVGTRNVIEAAGAVGVERFVLISTDKAVSPSSVMGATKRVAEMLTQAHDSRSIDGVYCSVRFGNVLGSRGSVVPTFIEQIAHGGPVTVTERDMERYFMTIDEAVHLVLQASALSEGGEVFVLDMGEPIKIVDLANRLIRLAGLVPGRDIEVIITGVRKGEKLKEVLSLAPLEQSGHLQVRIARPAHPDIDSLNDAVGVLDKLAVEGNFSLLREALRQLTFQEFGYQDEINLAALELELLGAEQR